MCCRSMHHKKNHNEKGFSMFEILVWIFIVAAVAAFIFNVAWPRVQAWKIKNTVSSEFSAIMSGIENYYQAHYQYPSGTDWSWNVNEAYIPQNILNKGWGYSCSGSTMTITTPTIDNQKALTSLAASLQRSCSNLYQNGNQLVCELNDRPCP